MFGVFLEATVENVCSRKARKLNNSITQLLICLAIFCTFIRLEGQKKLNVIEDQIDLFILQTLISMLIVLK